MSKGVKNGRKSRRKKNLGRKKEKIRVKIVNVGRRTKEMGGECLDLKKLTKYKYSRRKEWW